MVGDWFYHPNEDSAVDVAVQPFDASELDVSPIPQTMFLDDQKINDYYIGPGDEVSVTGLFTKLVGSSKNMPILRRGSVAMLPDEKLPDVQVYGGRDEVDAYLIEVRSIGGLSGSPAFVRAPIGLDFRVHNRDGEYRFAKGHVQGDYFFLGLVHGHWEIKSGQINSTDIVSVRRDDESLNLGIAIVVPAKKILEAINHPKLVWLRAEAERLVRQSMGTTTPDDANQ